MRFVIRDWFMVNLGKMNEMWTFDKFNPTHLSQFVICNWFMVDAQKMNGKQTIDEINSTHLSRFYVLSFFEFGRNFAKM